MNAHPLRTWLACFVLVAFGEAVCLAEPPKAGVPDVLVGQPVARVVTDYQVFTGRTEPISRVEVRARVTGYLKKVAFKEGNAVKQGDVLFQIDARPYRAEVDKAEAHVALAEARRKRADADLARAKALLAARAISKEEFDKILADGLEAQIAVKVAQANLAAAKLTLSFTTVHAPIAGLIGRRLVDPGSLVKADDTLLATLVSQGPTFAYFDVDERTALRLRRAVRGVNAKGKEAAGLVVTMGLADEKGFPHAGKVDFLDNRLDPEKGTLRMRAVFPNADGLLMPGLSVRLRLPIGEPRKALLVPENAIVVEKGLPSLFVVNEKNVVEVRRVVLGPGHDGSRVVKEGLKAGEWVVLGGLQRLRSGMSVKPRKEPAPSRKE